MKRAKVLLFIIVILASILRLYQLGKTPISLEWDEVAIGYDAYSILRTGKDQFGQFLPINFRSLDDYKPPLYVYSAIPTIALFGLTEFAVRLPSALFGIAAVILTYYLVLELFLETHNNTKYYAALLSSLLLAISPWHLQFSRAVFETNLSVAVTLAAVFLFMKGIHGNRHMFIPSVLFFGLALFSYHSTRVVTPLLLLSLLILFKKKLPGKKVLVYFFLIYGLFVYFFIPIAISRDAQIRFLVTNDLQIEDYMSESAKLSLEDKTLGFDIGGKIFHNRRLSYINFENFKRISVNYLKHFSPEFLFVNGDAPLHHAPGFGMMYLFELPFFVAGIFFYLKKFVNRHNFILLIWLLLGPLPAAVTWQSPHSVRSEIILPTLQVFTAIGVIQLFGLLRNESKILSRLTIIVLLPIFIYGIGLYLHQYYIHTNFELSRNWLYGRKEAVETTENLKNNYDKVLVSLKVDMPYIFWLFYSKYPPEKYLAEGGTVSGGFADERNHFDKYEFRNFDYNSLPSAQNLLLVGIPKDFPADARIIKTIYYLDGSEALKIGTTK